MGRQRGRSGTIAHTEKEEKAATIDEWKEAKRRKTFSSE